MYHDDDPDDELRDPNDCPEPASCPRCGERRIDHLEMTDDDMVKCLICGFEYHV